MALHDDAVGAFFGTVTEWLRELGGSLGVASAHSRGVIVPDFHGMSVSQTPTVAVRAGIRRKIIRVVESPPPVDGLVVAQDPAPGSRVARGSVVTLTVLHQNEPSRAWVEGVVSYPQGLARTDPSAHAVIDAGRPRLGL